MNENKKIQEAEYFLSMMGKTINDRQSFNFNLSAFLSAARSAFQYARKEAATKANGQIWYDSAIKHQTIVSFLKDKRDINIHAEPIKPLKEIHVDMALRISLSDAVSITITDKNGNISDQEIVPPSEPTRNIEIVDEPTVNHRYFFTDWIGNEDVIYLSQQYINELKGIVNDGVTRGFITG